MVPISPNYPELSDRMIKELAVKLAQLSNQLALIFLVK